jgi:hypothetical protein
LILAPPYSPPGALATGINLGFSAGLYDPYSRAGYKPVTGYWPGNLSVKKERKDIINLALSGSFPEADMLDPSMKVGIGHVYGSFADNTGRVIYNPSDSTHDTGMIDGVFIKDCRFRCLLGL